MNQAEFTSKQQYAFDLNLDKVCTDILKTLFLNFELRYRKRVEKTSDGLILFFQHVQDEVEEQDHFFMLHIPHSGEVDVRASFGVTMKQLKVDAYEIAQDTDYACITNIVTFVCTALIEQHVENELKAGRTSSPEHSEDLESPIEQREQSGIFKKIEYTKTHIKLVQAEVVCSDQSKHYVTLSEETLSRIQPGDWFFYDGKNVEVIPAGHVH